MMSPRMLTGYRFLPVFHKIQYSTSPELFPWLLKNWKFWTTQTHFASCVFARLWLRFFLSSYCPSNTKLLYNFLQAFVFAEIESLFIPVETKKTQSVMKRWTWNFKMSHRKLCLSD